VFRYERAVRFSEIDAARMVFFARFCDYCHEAIEALFDRLDGGYPRLTMVRDIGVPSVHIEFDFRKPLRYGDTVVVEVEVLRIGERSITFRHTLKRKSDDLVCAIARHVVVTARISRATPLRVPDDMRDVLAEHLVADERAV
jgi:4-hydroxybenzoyl-CoA thioesterase